MKPIHNRYLAGPLTVAILLGLAAPGHTGALSGGATADAQVTAQAQAELPSPAVDTNTPAGFAAGLRGRVATALGGLFNGSAGQGTEQDDADLASAVTSNSRASFNAVAEVAGAVVTGTGDAVLSGTGGVVTSGTGVAAGAAQSATGMLGTGVAADLGLSADAAGSVSAGLGGVGAGLGEVGAGIGGAAGVAGSLGLN